MCGVMYSDNKTDMASRVLSTGGGGAGGSFPPPKKFY